MKMFILFTPRRLSSYNATFTLSAKKVYLFILQHEFYFVWTDLFQQINMGEVEKTKNKPLMTPGMTRCNDQEFSAMWMQFFLSKSTDTRARTVL